MLTDIQVEWLKKQPKDKKEEIERIWLEYLVPENATVTASPCEESRWDATVTLPEKKTFWCENKMRFVPEAMATNGGLLTDLSKVEFLYSTGNGILVHYFPKEECCYVVKVGDPSEYKQRTGWYRKNNYTYEMVEKTVCYIPVTKENRRKINIKEIMRDAKGV